MSEFAVNNIGDYFHFFVWVFTEASLSLNNVIIEDS